MEHKSFIETFLNYDDASNWMEKHLDEHKGTEYHVIEARIVYINHQWRTGVVFAKKQMEFEFYE